MVKHLPLHSSTFSVFLFVCSAALPPYTETDPQTATQPHAPVDRGKGIRTGRRGTGRGGTGMGGHTRHAPHSPTHTPPTPSTPTESKLRVNISRVSLPKVESSKGVLFRHCFSRSLFCQIVDEEFQLAIEHEGANGALQQLSLFKKIVRRVGFALNRKRKCLPASGIEEKLACSIQARRAILTNNVQKWTECVRSFPYLDFLHCDPFLHQHSAHTSMNHIENLIQSLANEDIQARMDELRVLRESVPGFEISARKEHILRKMQRLIPGNAIGNVNAVVDPDSRKIISEPNKMAEILTGHWQNVFDSQPIDGNELSNWLAQIREKLSFSGDWQQFVPDDSQIEQTINDASEFFLVSSSHLVLVE